MTPEELVADNDRLKAENAQLRFDLCMCQISGFEQMISNAAEKLSYLKPLAIKLQAELKGGNVVAINKDKV